MNLTFLNLPSDQGKQIVKAHGPLANFPIGAMLYSNLYKKKSKFQAIFVRTVTANVY